MKLNIKAQLNSIALPINFQSAITKGVSITSLSFLIVFALVSIEGKFWIGQLIGPTIFVLGYVLSSCLIAAFCYWGFRLKNQLFLTILVSAPIIVRLLEAAYGWPLALINYTLFLVAISFFSCGVANVFSNTIKRFLCFFFSTIIIVFTVSLNHQLKQHPTINTFLKNYATTPSKLGLDNPAASGSYEYNELTYGTGKDQHRPEFGSDVDIVTRSVDGTHLLESWNGFTAILRKHFWGFSANELPLQGRVWLPLSSSKVPLILMVHGNHAMEQWSDRGYRYLGEHLASKGYAFVSVDQNFINGTNAEGYFGFGRYRLFGENDARAWLLLKHLEQWREWQQDETSPFYNKVDLNNIVLIGHSRGGEGVYTAAAFNTMKHYPDDASLEFDFNFNIKGIVSIAPSDTHYQPRGSLTHVDNVSYLTLQGTADGDATVFMGASAYYRTNFNDGDFHFKSSVMIYGANHSQFNSDWGECDKILYRCWLAKYYNSTISSSEQQVLAKAFVTAFAHTVTNRDKRYLPLFQNAELVSSWGYKHHVISNYKDSSAVIIADFEDDGDLSTANKGHIDSANLSHWSERKLQHHPSWPWTDLSTHAAIIEWEPTPNNSAYVLEFPAISVKDKCLGFSVANANIEDDAEKITNLSISIKDKNDVTSSLELTNYYKLYPSLIRKPDLYEEAINEPTFQSVQIPFNAFILKANGNISEIIQGLEFTFDKTEKGAIYLDDIYWSNCVAGQN